MRQKYVKHIQRYISFMDMYLINCTFIYIYITYIFKNFIE